MNLKPLLEEFGWDRNSLSLVGSFGMILVAVMEPLMGGITDRYGPRVMMIFESIVQGFSRMINGVASNIWHLYLARFMQVVGGERGTPVLLNRWFVKRRG